MFVVGEMKVPRCQGRLRLLKSQIFRVEGHFRGAGYNDAAEGHRRRYGGGVVSHVGSRLLADLGERTTLIAELSTALAGLRKPRARHDPGRVLVDMSAGTMRSFLPVGARPPAA